MLESLANRIISCVNTERKSLLQKVIKEARVIRRRSRKRGSRAGRKYSLCPGFRWDPSSLAFFDHRTD